MWSKDLRSAVGLRKMVPVQAVSSGLDTLPEGNPCCGAVAPCTCLVRAALLGLGLSWVHPTQPMCPVGAEPGAWHTPECSPHARVQCVDKQPCSCSSGSSCLQVPGQCWLVASALQSGLSWP